MGGLLSLWLMMGGLPVIWLIMKWSRYGFAADSGWDGGGDWGKCDYVFTLVIWPLGVYNFH